MPPSPSSYILLKTTYALTCLNAKSLIFARDLRMTPSEKDVSAFVSAIGWSWGASSVGKQACCASVRARVHAVLNDFLMWC